MADLSAFRSGGFNALVARGHDFSRWWLSELHEVIPTGWAPWLGGTAVPRLLFWREQDLVACRLSSVAGSVETQFSLNVFGLATLKAWLADQGFQREQIVIGPGVDRELFFLRDFSLPKAALAALPKILDQEVLRRTPFQLSEILHAAAAADDSRGDVLAMQHWIIRKDRADAFLGEFGLSISDIDFLATNANSDDFVPVISFRNTSQEEPAWARRAIKLLAVAGLGVVILGLGVVELSQSSVASGVAASLIEARQGAENGRDGIPSSARLFAMKADVGVLEIWDELSRILPDNTFLTETRIDESGVTVSGFSGDAARLVRIIDQSPLFSGATLAAPITPDATEQKDHFSVSFKVRGGRNLTIPKRQSPAS